MVGESAHSHSGLFRGKKYRVAECALAGPTTAYHTLSRLPTTILGPILNTVAPPVSSTKR
jgi:hypothetical protein